MYRITNEEEYQIVDDFIFHILSLINISGMTELDELLKHLMHICAQYEMENDK